MDTIMDISNYCTHQSVCCRSIQNDSRSMIPLVRPFQRTRVSLVSPPSIPTSRLTLCPCPRNSEDMIRKKMFINIIFPHFSYINVITLFCFVYYFLFLMLHYKTGLKLSLPANWKDQPHSYPKLVYNFFLDLYSFSFKDFIIISYHLWLTICNICMIIISTPKNPDMLACHWMTYRY